MWILYLFLLWPNNDVHSMNSGPVSSGTQCRELAAEWINNRAASGKAVGLTPQAICVYEPITPPKL